MRRLTHGTALARNGERVSLSCTVSTLLALRPVSLHRCGAGPKMRKVMGLSLRNKA